LATTRLPKAGDPVGEIGNRITIVVVWRALVEQIAIDIGGDHHELIDEADEQRLIFSRLSRGHRLLHNIISHAVSNEGDLCFAGFRRVVYGRLLFSHQPIEERAQNVCQILSTNARMRTIRLVAKDAAAQRPIVKDAKGETIWTVKKSPAKILIKLACRSELVVEPVHKNGDVALFLVLRRVVRGNLSAAATRSFSKLAAVTFRQLLISVSGDLSLTQKVMPSGFGSGPTPPLLRSLIIQYFGMLLSRSAGV
jgi:hypothetical protein